MKDPDLRKCLYEYLGIDENSRIVEEFVVGKSRMDLVLISNSTHGYEIESDHDTLNRLEKQLKDYIPFFDYLTVVTGEKYSQKVLEKVPSWIGILEIKNTGEITSLREATENKEQKPYNLLKVLWKSECWDLLEKLEYPRSWKAKRKFFLQKELQKKLSIKEIKTQILSKLLERKDWKGY